ncbi:hypothetical protein [Flavobacterium sp. HJSW_4]|uniref:TapB family protein n=1 Tax=Flavobacterium sp. HJSW_4 TaxID=3344660 RepID=UPI0035F353BB
MKQLICYLIISSFITLQSAGQECQNSLYTKKGASIQTTEYGADNAVKSVTSITVAQTGKNNTGDIISDLHSVKTEKGKPSEDKVLHYSCKPDQVIWGLGVDDAKTKKEAAIIYPKNMAAGQDLKTDVFYEATATNEKGESVKISLKINNRKVSGQQSITTKAGTWLCTKIIYDFEFKFKIGFIGIPIKAKVTEYYHPEVGVVRSEVRSKDKLESFSEITSIKAPK